MHRKEAEKLREKQEQTKNTGYPALDPTANKYLSGSGWEIMYFMFSPSFRFVFLCCYFKSIDRKCNNLKRLGEHIKQHKQTHK